MDRPTYNLTPGQLLTRGLDWCSQNKKYRDDDKHGRAVPYNRAWVQLIRRIKDYTATDNKKLIQLYDYLKNTIEFDRELKDIIIKCLIKEGRQRELFYFMSQEDGQKMVDEVFSGKKKEKLPDEQLVSGI